MSRKHVRIAIVPIILILAFVFTVPAIIWRITIAIGGVFLVIFIFARIASSGNGRTEEKNEQAVHNINSENANPEREGRASDGTVYTRKPDITDYSNVKDGERAEYGQMMEHIRSITSSLNFICCMDIRNAGVRVQRLAKDIIHEKYVENNSCRSFSQFKNYYLPTFRKTVENYSTMERKGISDLKIRDDMLAYLRSCEEAFGRLYNSMFDDDIMNMEVQMEAMNISLKRDGLL